MKCPPNPIAFRSPYAAKICKVPIFQPGFSPIQNPKSKFQNRRVGRYFCNELGRAIDLLEADRIAELADTDPQLITPFLGLTHVGFSEESVHLKSAIRNPHSAIKRVRSRKDGALIEFILSGKYARCLER